VGLLQHSTQYFVSQRRQQLPVIQAEGAQHRTGAGKLDDLRWRELKNGLGNIGIEP
jgi:hypothetical protein